MHRYGMWKLDTNNRTLSQGVLTVEDTRKIYNIQSDIKILLGRDCEVKKVMRFLKKVGVFEET